MLERICKEIEPFDKLDLLSKVAALQLASENAERATRWTRTQTNTNLTLKVLCIEQLGLPYRI